MRFCALEKGDLLICVWLGGFGGKVSSPDEQSGGGRGDVNGIQDRGNSTCKSTEARTSKLSEDQQESRMNEMQGKCTRVRLSGVNGEGTWSQVREI